ncbi:MAG: hypothetical protein V1809_07140 [Planctomycetota bacterium]
MRRSDTTMAAMCATLRATRGVLAAGLAALMLAGCCAFDQRPDPFAGMPRQTTRIDNPAFRSRHDMFAGPSYNRRTGIDNKPFRCYKDVFAGPSARRTEIDNPAFRSRNDRFKGIPARRTSIDNSPFRRRPGYFDDLPLRHDTWASICRKPPGPIPATPDLPSTEPDPSAPFETLSWHRARSGEITGFVRKDVYTQTHEVRNWYVFFVFDANYKPLGFLTDGGRTYRYTMNGVDDIGFFALEKGVAKLLGGDTSAVIEDYFPKKAAEVLIIPSKKAPDSGKTPPEPAPQTP